MGLGTVANFTPCGTRERRRRLTAVLRAHRTIESAPSTRSRRSKAPSRYPEAVGQVIFGGQSSALGADDPGGDGLATTCMDGRFHAATPGKEGPSADRRRGGPRLPATAHQQVPTVTATVIRLPEVGRRPLSRPRACASHVTADDGTWRRSKASRSGSRSRRRPSRWRGGASARRP